MNYEEKMLTALAEKYRKSKKDSGTNVIMRRTKLTPTKLYKDYNRNDGDISQIEAVNQAILQCSEKGFVTYEKEGFSNEIQSIYLVDEKIEEIESYLEIKYGYEPKSVKRKHVERLLALYGGRTPAAERECSKLRRALEQNKIPSKYHQTEDLLKALVFLEENTLTAVCRALRDYLGRPCGETELEDEILGEYHIAREKQKLCLKGDIILHIHGKELDLRHLSNGIEFFADEMDKIEKVQVQTPFFTTVENYTSWLRCCGQEESFFYLGGYATRSQRDFLKKIYYDNPSLTYRHFGDIDAGGLYIHEHLCRATGISFQMHLMSRAELEDTRFQSCLRPLSDNDRLHLESLEKQEIYQNLAGYMLEHGVKLEQEIISYYEY